MLNYVGVKKEKKMINLKLNCRLEIQIEKEQGGEKSFTNAIHRREEKNLLEYLEESLIIRVRVATVNECQKSVLGKFNLKMFVIRIWWSYSSDLRKK